MSPIRILIIDDHAIVRSGLRAMIGNEPEFQVVAEAANGEEGLEAWKTHRPDVTLMDLKMPGMDGVDCTAAICGLQPEARIIVLTTFDGEESIFRALRAGAHAYLLKEIPAEEFFSVMRAVHAGAYHLRPDLAARVAKRVPGSELSPREIEVLEWASTGDSNKEIARKLCISENTVKNHLNSIMTKLHARDRTEAVTTALKRGILNLV